MAIGAIQLKGAVWTFQIVAQMNCMIEFDGSGIRIARAYGGEFGMAPVEARNIVREMLRGSVAVQVCMALRAPGVGSGRKTQTATVLLMTRSTIRLERLIYLMDRPIVA
jgi:hypothetical protein